jgi:hypothetical protein
MHSATACCIGSSSSAFKHTHIKTPDHLAIEEQHVTFQHIKSTAQALPLHGSPAMRTPCKPHTSNKITKQTNIP